VRDEHDGGVDRLERPLQPFEVGDVEVVRRLVEEEQVGVAAESAAERGARQLAAGERVEPALQVRVGEAEPAEDGGGALAPVVAAGVLEPRLRLGVAAQRGRIVLARGHRLLEPAQLVLEGDEIARAGEHVLAQRQAPLEWRPLVVERDPRSLLERELSAVHLGLAGEHPQERRLAGAVRAGERQPFASLDLERDAVEEQRARELLAQVGRD